MKRIWGGDELKSWFHIDSEEPIGEYWVVSGHPNGESIVANGSLAGKTLHQLTEQFPASYLGHSPQPRFPLLVKFLEAHADLSVQIHPGDDYAKAHEGDFGKTEAWVVLDAAARAQVNLGHTFSSRAEYEAAVANGHIRQYLSYQDVEQGDVVYVPARTLHALLAGTKVLEVQQTSDVTYRVYDWDRVDASGNRRELHVEKAADVLEYGVAPPRANPVTVVVTDVLKLTRLISCPYFTIDSCDVRGQATLHLGKAGNPDIVVIVAGEGTLTCEVDGTKHMLPLVVGDALLIPSDVSTYTIETDPSDDLTAIRTFYS